MSLENLIQPQDLYELDVGEINDNDTEFDYYSDSGSEFELSAQEQWEESIKQVTGLVNFVLFPMIGKLLGRRTAHIVWRHFAEWWF
ncbi:CIC11C00000000167 [Sungouiella intermedia]|uniref:CIC11C00000000167 n=1 Tax=Sungouiella intermedia TaxID=45354 RepID=A0A1L0B968_9ASCO|nr:CIC11C00000000167 [[Candida] intermedia]